MNPNLIKTFPGVSMAYTSNHTIIQSECAGYSDVTEGIEVDASTIFPACSISKFATAILLMKLQEQGAIDLDEDINPYLINWSVRNPIGEKVKVTARQLLSHTAGIMDGEEAFYGLRLDDEPINVLTILEGKTSYNDHSARVEREPGSVFEYSDAGFCILQQLIEDVSGKKFEDVARELVFEPFGMKNTFFGTPENLRQMSSTHNLATGYDASGEPIEGKYPYQPDLAASALWSTPRDLVLLASDFFRALPNGYSKEMANGPKTFPWTGLGLFKDENYFISKGWGENGQCMMKMNRSSEAVAFIMTNKNPGVPQEESGLQDAIDSVFRRN